MLSTLARPAWLARRRGATPRPTTLRASLLALTAATLLPMFVAACIGALLLARHERATAERGAQVQVRALLSALDAELRSPVTSLQTLAQAEMLRSGQFTAFQATLARARAAHPDWINARLIDAATRRELFDALRGAVDSPVAEGTAEAVELVLASGQAAVSPSGPRPDRAGFTVAVPVRLDGRLRYVLSAELRPQALLRLLQAQPIAAGGVATVADRQLHVVARMPQHEQFVGRPATPGARAAIASEREGCFRGPALDGLAVHTCFARSDWSGWTVAVGMPAAALDAGARNAVAGLLAFLALGTLGALAAAHLWSRRIARPIAALADRARQPGSQAQNAPAPLDSELVEIAQLARSLEQGARAEAQAAAERARLLEREQALRADAEAANRSKDRFLAMLSHELRNPMSAMRVATELMRRTDRDSEAHERALEVMERQMRHLMRLVDDLMDAARVGSGKIELARRPVAVHALVREAVSGLGERCAAHTVQLALEPVWVAGDETRLEQIVSNLLGNALRYTPPGGVISVELIRQGTEAVLSVRDSGIGIAPELLPRLFQLFVQGQDGAAGGLGVGLALVRRLTELHGGSVSAASEGSGRGSLFRVRLPAIDAPAA